MMQNISVPYHFMAVHILCHIGECYCSVSRVVFVTITEATAEEGDGMRFSESSLHFSVGAGD